MSSIYCVDLVNLVRVPVHTEDVEITVKAGVEWLKQYGVEDYIYEIWTNGRCKSRWRHSGKKRWVRMRQPASHRSERGTHGTEDDN